MQSIVSALLSIEVLYAKLICWKPFDYDDSKLHMLKAKRLKQSLKPPHECYTMDFVLCGSLVFTTDKEQWQLEPGDIAVRPTGVNPPYCIHSLTGAEWARINLNAFLLNSPLIPLFSPPVKIRMKPEYVQLIGDMARCAVRNYGKPDQTSSMIVDACMRGIIGLCMQTQDITPWQTHAKTNNMEWFDRSQQAIQNNPAITVEALARLCGMSSAWYRKVFHRHLGISPKEYLRVKRLRLACELLLNSTMDIEHISEALGFGSVSHFCSFFTKGNGIPPLKYRRQCILPVSESTANLCDAQDKRDVG